MKEKMNTVEDRIFKGFCDSIGVSNIRQYEERELKSQQDREKKKMEHENQINRISNQLEYERKREEQLLTNQRKFERTVQDDEVCCYFFIFCRISSIPIEVSRVLKNESENRFIYEPILIFLKML